MTITIPVELTLTSQRRSGAEWPEDTQTRTTTFNDRSNANAVDARPSAPRTRFDLLNALRAQLLARSDVLTPEALGARNRINELAATFILDDGPTPQAIRGDGYFEVQWMVNGQRVIITVDDEGENSIVGYSGDGRTLVDEDFDETPTDEAMHVVRTALQAMSQGISTRAPF